ncbi:MAG TPA: DUF6143 family protein [Bacillota bacterium]|nr:DUF6143 family protein [Bacillota bacterium]
MLHVNVITVTKVIGKPFNAEFWLGAQFIGAPMQSDLWSPANTALVPPPVPAVKILLAANVPPIPPTGGVMIYSQLMYEEATIVYETDGRYLIPPGGSMVAYLNLIASQTTGRVAFGWWEEPLTELCYD